MNEILEDRLYDKARLEEPMDASDNDTETNIAPQSYFATIPLLEQADFQARYQGVKVINSGGQAIVCSAYNYESGKTIALRKMPLYRDIDRVLKEAKALQNLSHPNIVEMYGIFRYNDPIFGESLMLEMEFIEGETLTDQLAQKMRYNGEEIRKIRDTLYNALKHGHDKGIIHRDVKPSNIMITQDGIVKLLDYGIAKFIGSEEGTKTIMGAGSANYMAPEQIQREEITPATDLYGLGMTLIALASGNEPVANYDFMKDPMAYVDSLKHLDGRLRASLKGMIDTDPVRRFAGLEERVEALVPVHETGTALMIVDGTSRAIGGLVGLRIGTLVGLKLGPVGAVIGGIAGAVGGYFGGMKLVQKVKTWYYTKIRREEIEKLEDKLQ